MIISIILKEEDCLSFFGSTFPEVKAAGKLPLGQLPVLEVLVAIVGIIDNHYHDDHHDTTSTMNLLNMMMIIGKRWMVI